MSSLSVQISSSIGFAGWRSILIKRPNQPQYWLRWVAEHPAEEPSAWSDTKYKLSSEHALWPGNTEAVFSF
jgi:hypothetical protein